MLIGKGEQKKNNITTWPQQKFKLGDTWTYSHKESEGYFCAIWTYVH